MRRCLWMTLVIVSVGCESQNPSAPNDISRPLVAPRAASSPSSSPSPGPSIPPGQPNAAFKVHPRNGPFPLTVHFNMCGSSDVAPWVDLRYNVDFGDGASDQGFCRISHEYTTAGTYTAKACVSDRVAAHEPGVCETFTIEPFCELDVTAQLNPVAGLCFGTVFVGQGSCSATQVLVTQASGATFTAGLPASLSAALPPGYTFKFRAAGSQLAGITYAESNPSCHLSLHTVAP